MSTVAELVEEEEEIADAEELQKPQPEPEPEDESESDPGPEPEANLVIGPQEIEKAERARAAYRKKIGAILGPEAVAHECLLCAGLGHLPDLPPTGTTFAIVLTDEGPQLLAEEPRQEPPYVQARDKTECPECNGYGQVLSGSKNAHARVVGCSKCQGNGWVIVALADPIQAAPAPYAVPAPTVNGPTETPGMVDAWGRPAGHQHWGVPPANVAG